ncbi:site-specific integrase [bacterium]|nr:site-specific integrase [bacterium]
MPRDLKDLKNFKGNDYGSDFILVPVDRKKKVEDIKNLELHEVNVCGYVGDKNETGNRRVPVKLLRLDKLKDGVSQFGQLWDKLEEKKKKARDKASANSSGETLGVEHTLSELIDKFLVDVAWEFKDFKSYRQRCGYWKVELGKLLIEEVTTGLIKERKILLKKEGKRPATVNRYVESLQRAFRFAIDIGWADDCPISNKKVPKDPEEKRVRWLDDDELEKLFAALELSSSKNLYDMVHFSLNTGCRKSEALGLRWKDVDFKNNRIYFRVVKRGRQCVNAKFNKNGEPEFEVKSIVFEEGLKNGDNVKVQKLENMPKVREILIRRRGNPELVSSSEFVFPNNTLRSWYSLLERIGIEDFRWHDLRHCCASYLRQDGKDLGIIGSHLGHKDAASTARYSHLSGEETLETGAAISKRLYG